jgi:hypothetical protein
MIVPVWGLLILLGFVGERIVGNATKLRDGVRQMINSTV